MMGSISEQLAEWIFQVGYNDIPERVREKARYQILNVLASCYAGHSTPGGQAVFRAVSKWSGGGPCMVIPTGERFPLHEAVLINCAYSMALDYDDYLYMGHTGHSAVLAGLALGEQLKLGTEDLITAQVIANEIGGRIGASCVLGPQNGQAWSFIHAAGAAALAAKLLGLSQEQTAHALAIALYQPPFTLWPGFMGPQSKLLTAAWPTVTGIQAAQFAKEWMTGSKEIFEHPQKGFWASFTFVPLPHLLTGLGQAWVTDTLTFKRYPGCAYIDTTLDALFAAMNGYEKESGKTLGPSDVRRIDVEASLLSVEMDNLSSEYRVAHEPLSSVNINFSIALNVAIALIAGRHTAFELSEDFLKENEKLINRLAGLVNLRHDWEMTLRVAEAFDQALGRSSISSVLRFGDYLKMLRGYRAAMGGKRGTSIDLRGLFSLERKDYRKFFASLIKRRLIDVLAAFRGQTKRPDLAEVDFTHFRMTFPAKVTIETNEGRVISSRQDIPFGAPGQEKYFESVEEKFLIETGSLLAKERAEQVIRLIRNFEKFSIDQIIDLLRLK